MPRYYFVAFVVLVGLLTGCHDADSKRWELGENVCGNGAVEEFEVCDRRSLAGMDCTDFGYEGGELRCNDLCTGYLIAECTGMPSWSQRPECPQCANDEVWNGDECVAAPRGEYNLEHQHTYDIRSVTITGTVRGFAEFEESGTEYRRTLYFWNTTLQTFSHSEVEADGSYRIPLLDGYTYRIFFRLIHSDTYQLRALHELTSAPLHVDGDRTLDLAMPQPVELSGLLRISGSNARATGTLEITHTTAGDPPRREFAAYRNVPVSVEIDSINKPDFSAMVYPGRYRIRFLADDQSELDSHHVADAFEVRGDTFRELDLVFHMLRGSIEIPEGLELASTPTISDRYPIELDETGRFEQQVQRGTHEIELTLTASDSGSFQRTYDYQVEVYGDTEVELRPDPQLVTVTGELRGLDEFEAEPGARLTLTRLDDDVPRDSFELELDGEDFTVDLPQGQYRAELRYGERPWRDKIRFGEVTVEEGSHLQFEVPTPDMRVRLHGAVTMRGAQPPESESAPSEIPAIYHRAGLNFIAIAGKPAPDIRGVPLPARGAATYEVELFAGVTYRVELFVPQHSSGGHGHIRRQFSPLPLGKYVLQPELEVEHGHRRDFDFKTVRLKTEVTAHGRELPSITIAGSSDRQVSISSASDPIELPSSGPAIYEADFFPGNTSHYLTLSHLRSSDGVWARHCIPVSEDTTAEISLPLQRAHVRLTQNGHEIHSSESYLGSVRYETPWGKTSGSVKSNGSAEIWWFGTEPKVTFESRSNGEIPNGEMTF